MMRYFFAFCLLSLVLTLQAQTARWDQTDVDSLIRESIALKNSGDAAEGVQILLYIRQDRIQSKDDSLTWYGRVQVNLGEYYIHTGKKYDSAEYCFMAAKRFLESHQKQDTEIYCEALLGLGKQLKMQSQYAEAKPYYLKTFQRMKTAERATPYFYPRLLEEMASLYRYFNIYDSALIYARLAKEDWENQGRTYKPDYYSVLNSLALTHSKLGQLAKAESYYRQSIAGMKEHGYDAQMNYYVTLFNLGKLYFGKGQYDFAEQYYLQAHEAFIKHTGSESYFTSVSMNALGDLFSLIRKFRLAETYLLGAREIQKKIYQKPHQSIAVTLNSLGNLYVYRGQFEKGIPFFHEALEMNMKVYKGPNLNRSYILGALAGAYQGLAMWDSAIHYEQKKLKLQETLFDQYHPVYLTSLIDLGYLNLKKGNMAEAEACLLKASKLREEVQKGQKERLDMICLMNMGSLYLKKKDFDQAESYLLEAAKVQQELNQGQEYMNYPDLMRELGSLYQTMGKNELAIPYYLKAVDSEQQSMKRESNYFSEKDITALTKRIDKTAARLFSLISESPVYQDSLSSWAYDHRLFHKGLLLAGSGKIPNLLEQASDSTRRKYSEWKALHRRLAKGYTNWQGRRSSLSVLEEEANLLEQELVREIADFAQLRTAYHWRDVQKELAPDEAAIEFVHFRYFQPDKTDSVLYGALIVRPEWEAPRFIPLFEQNQLESLLADPDRIGTRKAVNLTYSNNLYELVWNPMEDFLDGVGRVYYSPEGLLHRINFSAIPFHTSSRLMDRYELVYTSSSRNLLVQKEEEILDNHSAMLYGNISYDIDSTEYTFATSGTRGADGIVQQESDQENSRGRYWYHLPHSKRETDRLAIVMDRFDIDYQTLEAAAATEESILNIGKEGAESPTILHLATHGFFSPDPDLSATSDTWSVTRGRSLFENAENPLLRSGLILAGANQVWKEGKWVPGREDGILTAYEISGLTLDNAELVSLSACKTGLGDIKGSEGVYGLQRAFKQAGVEYLLLTLWSIEDGEATIDFMETFYEKWLSGIPIRQAFQQTQRMIKEMYPDPYYWAGFLLID